MSSKHNVRESPERPSKPPLPKEPPSSSIGLPTFGPSTPADRRSWWAWTGNGGPTLGPTTTTSRPPSSSAWTTSASSSSSSTPTPSPKRFVVDPTFVFAGVEVAGDVAKLRAEYGLGCAKVADLREMARAKWPGKFDRAAGLKELAREICGLEVAKSDEVRLSDWAAAELSGAQVEYACIDAYASFRVGQALILGA